MAAGDADVAQLTIVHRPQRFDRFPAYPERGKAIGPVAKRAGETAKGGCGSGLCSRVDRSHLQSPVVMQRPSTAGDADAGKALAPCSRIALASSVQSRACGTLDDPVIVSVQGKHCSRCNYVAI